MKIRNNNSSEIITASEVAEELKVGKVKAYELMKNNEISSFRVGTRNIRTTRQALECYIQQKIQEIIKKVDLKSEENEGCMNLKRGR